MSLKSIEMQVALPRTQEAGKLQEQLQQRGHQLNEQALERVRQEEERQRKTVTENNRKDEAKLQNDDEQSNNDQQYERREQKKEHKKIKVNHPYKGKRIDFSG